MRETYSGKIASLKDNEVFLFGANPVQIQGGGAALVASKNNWCGRREFMGNRLSDCGKAYGLVTVEGPGQPFSLTPEEICSNISKFYYFAEKNPDLRFLIAYTNEDPQQTSLNGYRTIDMAVFFMQCGKIPENIVFEDKFYELMQEVARNVD